ncbi:HRDC domain-containing protein [Flavobacterium sp. 25HG05S-40]|uniref:HRDC domain-containing protein n=1 Tax=Flavobacterium sp. 25HG05S-40 TaxID=3458682 RepID=UPI004044E98D
MNIKVFNIRLAKEFCQYDQDRMNEFLDSVEVKLTSTNFVTSGTTDYWSAAIFYIAKSDKKHKEGTKFPEEDLLPFEQNVFNALRDWRKGLAQKVNKPLYSICHNSHLIQIAKTNPQTLEELEEASGFGKSRTEKYGDAILTILNAL